MLNAQLQSRLLDQIPDKAKRKKMAMPSDAITDQAAVLENINEFWILTESQRLNEE